MKEELHKKDQFISSLETSLEANDEAKNEMIRHMTGMNRAVATQEQREFHSVQRTSGIQSRIQRAEAAERKVAGPIMVQRQKEYNERLDSLLGNEKVETEVIPDAV